jgi:hypothetical protein
MRGAIPNRCDRITTDTTSSTARWPQCGNKRPCCWLCWQLSQYEISQYLVVSVWNKQVPIVARFHLPRQASRVLQGQRVGALAPNRQPLSALRPNTTAYEGPLSPTKRAEVAMVAVDLGPSWCSASWELF